MGQNFCAERTNTIKTKITCLRLIADGCIWEEISLINAWILAVSVSQSLVIPSERLDKNYCQIQGRKKVCVQFCHAPDILLRGTKYYAQR